ncbi:MAG: dTMP kinase [Halobacteriota archaeon]|nr:dTMP kinase [Halobacteriota archaeon]
MKGDLITIEGIDGSGKSTILRFLKERLRNYDLIFTQEPTKGFIGDVVRGAISDDTDHLAEAFLFVADHAEHVNRLLKPSLESGKMVISDRYSDSRYAYQGVTLSDIFDDPVRWLQDIHGGWTIVPDLTVLLDVDPNIAVKRCSRRFSTTKFEKVEFLTKVRSNYLRLAKEEPDRFFVVDSGGSLKNMKNKVGERIEELILTKNH